MTDLRADHYVKLSSLFICEKHFPPAAPIEMDWVHTLAESMKAGSPQMEPIGAQVCVKTRTPETGGSCEEGKLAVTHHYHTYMALLEAFGPEKVVRITQTEYAKGTQHILGQARNQNTREISMKEFYGFFCAPIEEDFPTQKALGKAVGRPEAWMSKAKAIWEGRDVSYLPENRRLAREPELSPGKDINVSVPPSAEGSPAPGARLPSVPLIPPPNSGGSPPPPISLIPETPPETGSSSTSPALSGSTGGTTGARASASRAASAGGSSVAPAPPSFLSPPSPPSPLRRLREALEGLQGTMKMPEWEDALDDESVARAARDLLASLDASLYDFRAYLDDGRRSKDGPLPRAQVFTLKIRDEVRIKTEENGHRAFVMAHLPSGRAKLRVIRDGKKSEEIHLERDLIPVIHVGAKA